MKRPARKNRTTENGMKDGLGRLAIILSLIGCLCLSACVEEKVIPTERMAWTASEYLEEAQRLRQEGEYLAESTILAEGVGRFKDDSYMASRLGMVYRRLGKRIKAVEQFKRAIAIERKAGRHDVQELERVKQEILSERKDLKDPDEAFMSEFLSGTAVELGAMFVGIIFVTIWGFILNHWFNRRHFRQLKKYAGASDWDGIAHILVCEYKREHHEGLVKCLSYLYERMDEDSLKTKIRANIANVKHETGIIRCLDRKVIGVEP